MHGVGHPAAGLHLVGVQPPELQLLLEEGAAHVSRVVQLARPDVREEEVEITSLWLILLQTNKEAEITAFTHHLAINVKAHNF